jgi:replicative DNA helicase
MPETTAKIQTTAQKIAQTRSSQSDLSSMIFSKVPPQANELEEAVLGAMLLDRDSIAEVIEILRPESFYVDAHQTIYKAILHLFEKTKPVDILTVTEELKLMGELERVEGPYYISQLTSKVASSAHVVEHARIISEKFIQRELIKVSTRVIKDSYDDTVDVFELLDTAEQGLFEITENNLKTSYVSISQILPSAIKSIEDLTKLDDAFTGIPSGFPALDRITSGWQNSDLIIIAARPGMGKTSFTLSLARNAAIHTKKSVAFFSLEMSKEQLVTRLISSETELESEKLKKGNLKPFEWTQLTTKAEALAEAPIFIDDTPGINIFELRAKCRRLKRRHNIDLVIIDYLQLMSGTNTEGRNSNREQEISNISRSLKGIAKELNIPIIALSQLNRSVETRGGEKRPQLSDLRESGAIEQDADMVAFIYRPEYYQLSTADDGSSLKGLAEIIIAKHRNGALANIPLKFVGKFTRFQSLETMPGEPGSNFRKLEDDKQTITKSSRMNEKDGSVNFDNSPPFGNDEDGDSPPFA